MEEEKLGCEAAKQPAVRPMDEVVKHRVTISPLDRGCVVEVGCKSFAFETMDAAIFYVSKYLKDPKGTVDKFWRDTLFDETPENEDK